MNKVILIGNLTRDPELSETNSGIAVCRFGLAVNRQYSSSDGERETDFFQVTAWRGNIYAKIGDEIMFCSNHKRGQLTEDKAEPSYPVHDVEISY